VKLEIFSNALLTTCSPHFRRLGAFKQLGSTLYNFCCLLFQKVELRFVVASVRCDADHQLDILLDLAPNFYPALSSLRRLIMPCWACDAMAMGA
jgi:hypothetical protein